MAWKFQTMSSFSQRWISKLVCSTDLYSEFHYLRKFCFNLPLKTYTNQSFPSRFLPLVLFVFDSIFGNVISLLETNSSSQVLSEWIPYSSARACCTRAWPVCLSALSPCQPCPTHSLSLVIWNLMRPRNSVLLYWVSDDSVASTGSLLPFLQEAPNSPSSIKALWTQQEGQTPHSAS